MLSMTLEPHALRYGLLEVPYAHIVGAGVGVSVRKLRTHRTILVAYRPSPGVPPRCLALRLHPADEGFAALLRARLPDRWHGESSYFGMRKALGFDNRRVFLIVAVLTLLVVAGVVAALALSLRARRAEQLPSSPATTSVARRR